MEENAVQQDEVAATGSGWGEEMLAPDLFEKSL